MIITHHVSHPIHVPGRARTWWLAATMLRILRTLVVLAALGAFIASGDLARVLVPAAAALTALWLLPSLLERAAWAHVPGAWHRTTGPTDLSDLFPTQRHVQTATNVLLILGGLALFKMPGQAVPAGYVLGALGGVLTAWLAFRAAFITFTSAAGDRLRRLADLLLPAGTAVCWTLLAFGVGAGEAVTAGGMGGIALLVVTSGLTMIARG